ncbi:MAG: inositol monophosphatase [Acidimicrobiia bacterium]|nr:inositol monophosphatase [Acidimicrobiia bacterium]
MQDLEVGRKAAQAGAAVVREWFGTVKQAGWKTSDVDPVTAADLASQSAVIAVIEQARPGDAILAEEDDTGELVDGRMWVIDPLDGTVNFFHGVPHVGVSVALVEDGVPIVGVVVDVFADKEYRASAGAGAFCDGAAIQVSAPESLGRSLVATGYPYDRRQRPRVYTDINAAVIAEVQGIRRFGAATLDLAWTAAGMLDGYWELALAPWDVAAGMVLVEEGGGLITNHEGRRSRLDDALFVAAPEAIHGQFLEVLAAAIPKELL